MFKKTILIYFYANLNKFKTFIIFVNICEYIKNYFENIEHKKIILQKKNNIILKLIIKKQKNKQKIIEKYFQIFVKKLREFQYNLN